MKIALKTCFAQLLGIIFWNELYFLKYFKSIWKIEISSYCDIFVLWSMQFISRILRLNWIFFKGETCNFFIVSWPLIFLCTMVFHPATQRIYFKQYSDDRRRQKNVVTGLLSIYCFIFPMEKLGSKGSFCTNFDYMY